MCRGMASRMEELSRQLRVAQNTVSQDDDRVILLARKLTAPPVTEDVVRRWYNGTPAAELPDNKFEDLWPEQRNSLVAAAQYFSGVYLEK